MSRHVEAPIRRQSAPDIRARKGGDPIVMQENWSEHFVSVSSPQLLLVGCHGYSHAHAMVVPNLGSQF